MVFCGVMQAATRHKWRAFQVGDDSSAFWTTGDLIGTALYLALICGYSIRTQPATRQGWRRWMAWIVDGCAWLLASFWLLLVLEDGMLITALVHIAIRGVEAAQPTRLAGRPFYPPNLHVELMQQVVGRAYLTGALLAAATIANIALARTWSKGLAHRTLWAAAACAFLLPATWLIWWCAAVALPQLSPFFFSVLGKLPPGNTIVALAIVVAGAAVIAARVCAERRLIEYPTEAGAAIVPLHEWMFVPPMFFFGALGTAIELVRSAGWFEMLSAVCIQPRWIMWLAALILLAQRTWHWLRPDRAAETIEWTVPTARFAAVWTLALLTGVLLIPAASWFGFALCMRWRGP